MDMNKILKKLNLLVLSVLLFFLLPSVSVANNVEVAKLPYDSLLQLQDTMLKTLPLKLPFRLHIFSHNPEITSNDITLLLVSDKETVKIPINKFGFIELPIRRDLVGKGAYVVTDQPKGTMALQGESVSQIPLQNQTISYRELISPVVATKSVSEIAKNIPEVISERHIQSLHLIVEQEYKMPVIIRLGSQQLIEIHPDECGNVLIPIEDYLVNKGTVVEFPSDKVFFTKPWK